MVIFTKKLGQLKQWTGEKFGSTSKTQKPTEIKKLQNETRSRFDGISNIRNALSAYIKSLDESRNSSMGKLAQAISSQSHFHGENEYGTLLVTFGDGVSKLSDHQNEFAEEIRMGLLMNLDALLNETKEFERLRKKLKNRRLDYDANNNKLQKSKKEDPASEENVKTTKLKYEETLHKLEEKMVTVSKQETELIDPFISFVESQINYYHNCLKTSECIVQILNEGKTDLKSIDFVASSFRRELEEDEFWLDSKDDSEEEISSEPTFSKLSIKSKEKTTSEIGKKEEKISAFLVKANYNFIAEAENELSIKKGNIIKVIKKIDEGWWVGSLNDKIGMFPSNYVTAVEKNDGSDNKYKANNIDDQPKLESDEIDESKFMQTLSKPGFSYLPQNAPITFIGRKGNQVKTEDNQPQANVSDSCGDCDCEEFSANVFKQGYCNNCFHKH